MSFLVSLVGFGPGGIVAGSYAASAMAMSSPVQSGSTVAVLQSIGAAGLANPWIIAVPVVLAIPLCYKPLKSVMSLMRGR